MSGGHAAPDATAGAAPFVVRPAGRADAPVLARHRAEMFTDMGTLPSHLYDGMVEASCRYFETAIPAGEYVGWVAVTADDPEEVIAGAGVQLRRALPRPRKSSKGVELVVGPQGLVLNVFTERAWRRRGLAELLMNHVIEWARANGVSNLVLHASDDGRRLYERLGFVPTNEMRYTGDL